MIFASWSLQSITPVRRTLAKSCSSRMGDSDLGKTIKLGPSLSQCLGRTEISCDDTSVIAFIERLSEENLSNYSAKALELYEHSFPNPDEREPVEEIIARIKRYSKTGPDKDAGEFHAHVFLDSNDRVLGYSQGSVMPCGKAGLAYFWQYGAVADKAFLKNAYGVDSFSARKMGISRLIHQVNDLTLQSAAIRASQTALGELWESEEKGLGESEEEIKFTHLRLEIHSRAGGLVMLGCSKTSPSDFINLHLQPRLTKETEPVALHLMFRQVGSRSLQIAREMDVSTARSIVVDGFLDNFIREGFDKSDVAEAKLEVEGRLSGSSVVKLLPASQVPDVITLAESDVLLRKQVLDMYKCDDLSSARLKHDGAMTNSG